MKTSIALCFIFLLLTQVSAKQACEMETIQQCLKNELAKESLTGSVTTFAAYFSAKLALWMAGFSSIGPVAGSLAAWLQSVYGVGPIFSLLQSMAMGKVSILLGPAFAVGAVTGFVYYFSSCLKIQCIFSHDEHENINQNDFSNWEKIKNVTTRYMRIVKEKTNFILEVIQYALNLILEEYNKKKQQQQHEQQDYQQEQIVRFIEENQKCYFQNNTSYTFDEFLNFVFMIKV